MMHFEYTILETFSADPAGPQAGHDAVSVPGAGECWGLDRHWPEPDILNQRPLEARGDFKQP